MVSMARTENDALRVRIAELETKLDTLQSKPAPAAKKKAAAKSSTPKK
jgi:BMFP domain-containing protein YqiC